MTIDLDTLAPFHKICTKICLNIPANYSWTWDETRNMAAIVLDEEDAELVFYPLFKEFQNHWNFSSISEADQAVNTFVHAEFGLLPGQALFTSHMLHDLVLGVAWWPWGRWCREDKVSMRVGLIPVDIEVPDGFVYQCLSRWLEIVKD